MFQRLANGTMTDYTGEGQGAGIFSSGVNYPTNCLVSMALYCLLVGDDAHGQMAANAIYNYYKALEPRIDDILAASPNEFAFTPALAKYSATQWKGMGDLAAQLDLGLALDFAGHWMTADQIDLMRRVIVKATYGRRTTAGNGLSHLLALAAIEGLPGSTPRATPPTRNWRKVFSTGASTKRASSPMKARRRAICSFNSWRWSCWRGAVTISGATRTGGIF